jgi:integrase/recombinase XerC
VRVIRKADLQRDQDLIDEFKNHLIRQDLAEATIRAYLSDLDVFQRWLSWVFEGRPVSLVHVHTAELAAFRKSLIREKNQQPASVNRRVQTLRTFYGFLAEQGVIEEDPAHQLRFVRLGAATQPRALSRQEVLSLLRAAQQSGEGMARRNTAILQLMLQTGLRVGEVAALQVEDVQLRQRSGLVVVREGKGRRARQVPLNAAARRALDQYLATRGEGDSAPTAAFFKSKRAAPLTVRGLQKMILTLVRRADLDREGTSAHTLRHTFATDYLKSRPGKLVDLATLLGHESLDTTAIYTRPSHHDLSEDLEHSGLNLFEEI